jgi:hypothetical protein
MVCLEVTCYLFAADVICLLQWQAVLFCRYTDWNYLLLIYACDLVLSFIIK